MDIDHLIGLNIGLELIDSVLFLNDFLLDPMVTAIDLKNNSVISEFLPIGRGPNEFLPPVQLDKLGDMIYVFERQTSTLERFSASMIYDDKINFERVWASQNSLNTLIPLKESVFLATTLDNQSRFVLLDAQGEVIKRFGDYPDFMSGESKYSNQARSLFHQTFFVANGQDNIIAAIAPHVLELYSYDEAYDFTLLRQIQLSEYEYQPHTSAEVSYVRPSAGTARGALSFCGTNDYIYILYDHENEQSYLNSDKRNNEIWIFDWDGNPVEALMPDRDLATIAVDKTNSRIYAVDKNSELYRIYTGNTTR